MREFLRNFNGQLPAGTVRRTGRPNRTLPHPRPLSGKVRPDTGRFLTRAEASLKITSIRKIILKFAFGRRFSEDQYPWLIRRTVGNRLADAISLLGNRFEVKVIISGIPCTHLVYAGELADSLLVRLTSSMGSSPDRWQFQDLNSKIPGNTVLTANTILWLVPGDDFISVTAPA